jgi:uncharacterized protein YifE (UPF0438 family)
MLPVSDTFELPKLTHLKYLFSTSETERLAKYGSWALALENGSSTPKTEKQVAFIAVCKGEKDPETEFEFLWLRYRATYEADSTISRLTEELGRSQNHAEGLRRSLWEQIERSKAEVERLNSTVSQLQSKLTSYEKRLGISTAETAQTSTKEWNSREICPNCGGDGGAAGQCYKCDGTGWISV